MYKLSYKLFFRQMSSPILFPTTLHQYISNLIYILFTAHTHNISLTLGDFLYYILIVLSIAGLDDENSHS